MQTHTINHVPSKLCRPKEIQARISVRHAKFWALVKSGAFGEPLKIGRCTLFASEAVDAFIAGLSKGAAK